MRIQDMTVEELKALVHEAVEEALLDLLGDPDAGGELREEVKQRLLASVTRTHEGQVSIPAEKVARSLGLDW